MSENENLKKVKDFFKTNVIINELNEILTFKPDTLIGIDKVSADILKENDIHTIADLGKLSSESPPEVSKITPAVLIKWIKIAQILEKAVKDQLKEAKKILMIGLDNGGKSALF